MIRHLITDLSYRRNVLTCSCGERMPASPSDDAWLAHRRSVGAPTRNSMADLRGGSRAAAWMLSGPPQPV